MPNALSLPFDEHARIARDVASGLRERPRRLPSYLFYDAEGARLYERITMLPEYYLWRAERAIFEHHASEIIELAGGSSPDRLRLVELGAGSARKSQLLLEALVQCTGAAEFWPTDVSSTVLEAAERRLAHELPTISVFPIVAHHEEALERIRALGPSRLVLFIGSSIGNYNDGEALRLLRAIRESLLAGEMLLLGADLPKSLERLLPAYDDAQGVTAAFNKNALVHVNRVLGANFEIDRFRHVALWNADDSRVEMHLESLARQRVRIDALNMEIVLEKGERIHTESSVKYDQNHVERLLAGARFAREKTLLDPERQFAVYLARSF
jgi:L-histidine N-alpha-methyltransferase